MRLIWIMYLLVSDDQTNKFVRFVLLEFTCKIDMYMDVSPQKLISFHCISIIQKSHYPRYQKKKKLALCIICRVVQASNCSHSASIIIPAKKRAPRLIAHIGIAASRRALVDAALAGAKPTIKIAVVDIGKICAICTCLSSEHRELE